MCEWCSQKSRIKLEADDVDGDGGDFFCYEVADTSTTTTKTCTAVATSSTTNAVGDILSRPHRGETWPTIGSPRL